jgi:hypothetical protein
MQVVDFAQAKARFAELLGRKDLFRVAPRLLA